MAEEMKKRAVLDALRQNYNRICRLHRGTPKHAIIIQVHLDKFPKALKLTLDDLKLTLLDIEKEYKGKIKVLPLNDNNARIKRDFYPVRVKPKTFSREVRSDKKPTISEHDGYWGVTLPGESQFIHVGRKGSLKGELFKILGERWGSFQAVDYVLEVLEEKVEDMRTEGHQSPEIILEHKKEINKTLYEASKRRLKRIGEWPRTVGVIWEHILWNVAFRTRRGVLMVGLIKVRKPTRMKEKISK